MSDNDYVLGLLDAKFGLFQKYYENSPLMKCRIFVNTFSYNNSFLDSLDVPIPMESIPMYYVIFRSHYNDGRVVSGVNLNADIIKIKFVYKNSLSNQYIPFANISILEQYIFTLDIKNNMVDGEFICNKIKYDTSFYMALFKLGIYIKSATHNTPLSDKIARMKRQFTIGTIIE